MVEVAIVIALIVLQGILAATEVAVVSARREQMREVKEHYPAAAAAAMALRQDPGPFSAGVQVGITVMSTTAGALGAAILAQDVAAYTSELLPAVAPYAHVLSLIGVTLAIAVTCVTLGNLIPISFALRAVVGTISVFARPLWWFCRVMRPITWLLATSSDSMASHWGEQSEPEAPHGPEALRHMMEEAQRSGSVHPRAVDIATRALTFGDLTVADVMVPRNRVKALEVTATPEDVRRILLEEGHSCMPVYEGTLDQVVGVLVARDVLALAWERELIVLEDLLQPPYFAPEIMRAVELLKELQRRRMHFAIAVDELGGTAGIVTVEDLLEELVGEIYGGHDEDGPAMIRTEADGTAVVQGIVPIRDINRELRLDLAEGDTWSTVGGLCISLAGRIPEVGNKLAAGDGTHLEILDASPRRVRLVRLRRAGNPNAAAKATPPPARS